MRGRSRGPLPFLSFLLGVAGCVFATSCTSVDPGGNFQIAQIVYDENYFYCQVEPAVLLAKQCASGDPAVDRGGGCHSGAAGGFSLVDHTPVTCDGNVPTGAIPSESRLNNYPSATTEMAPDVELAGLLTHPTGKTTHPRAIFATDSPEATIIREWSKRRSR